jgi:HAD superfamily hydrolase (TIGR01509 family)
MAQPQIMSNIKKPKAVLFDVDGVLILPPRMFSEIYCDRYGKDLTRLEQFYQSKEFQDSLIGKNDLKDAIRDHQDKWQWNGYVEDLLDQWFEGENYPNKPLLSVVDKLRGNGIKVYIVTAQEKYRSAFLKNKVFAGKYDGFLASCDISFQKHSLEFWQEVVDNVGEKPDNIIYFDDKESLVETAKSIGINAHVYQDVQQVIDILGTS